MRDTLRKIPLFGGLVDTSPSDHFSAIKENTSGLLVSLSPLLISGLILCLTDEKVGSYFSAVWSNASNGELFLYSTSILAPIFHIALDDPPRAKRFPSKFSHLLLTGVILLLIGIALGLQRAGVTLLSGLAMRISLWSFGFSVLLLYLATVYRNSRSPSSPEIFQEQEQDFAIRYRKHRR